MLCTSLQQMDLCLLLRMSLISLYILQYIYPSALFIAEDFLCHAHSMHGHMHQYITSWMSLMMAARRQLATDVDFRWAQDSYSKTRRTVDIWAALAVLRVRTWLLDAKWSSVSHPSPLSPRCPPGPEGASGAVLRECAIHIVSAILCWTLLLSAIMQVSLEMQPLTPILSLLVLGDDVNTLARHRFTRYTQVLTLIPHCFGLACNRGRAWLCISW